MKSTVFSGLDHLIYNAIAKAKEANNSFNNAKKEFYDENNDIDIQKAINLKYAKEQFDKANMRLYDVLTTKRILKELESKGVEV